MTTPLMHQYYEVKSQNPGCVLFFRMGDFFELFEDDAVLASRILGITLTSRNNGASGATPLCGFPHHAAERYIPKMIAAGHRVAVSEQVEDPKLAKGIVKREVIEVISAGTAMSATNLEAKEPSYLCALCPPATMKEPWALAMLDVTTGHFYVAAATATEMESELYRRLPREILWPEETELFSGIKEYLEAESAPLTGLPKTAFAEQKSEALLLQHFHLESLEGLGLDGRKNEVRAAGAALAYVLDQKKCSLDHIMHLEVINLGETMTLDPATLRNLELVRPLNAEDRSSTLCAVLDHTVTAMGGRKLREWISHPLVNAERINARQGCVAELVAQPVALDDLTLCLREIQDMERLLGRIGSGRANGRDLQGLGKSLERATRVGQFATALTHPRLQELGTTLNSLSGRGERILSVLLDELPLTIREGGLICPGADAELDKLNEDIRSSREWLSSLEVRERERLGISSLKVGFNKVFGYYLEVTTQNLSKVPPEYIRKQTIANGERYITPEMKDCEALILNAETRIHDKEYRVFCSLRDEVNTWRAELQFAADAVAEVDVLASLAQAARHRGYVRPEVGDWEELEIRGGMHPVITAVNPDLSFIPNDVALSSEATRLMLITGPNMAGKSTYLRQTGLIVLMAQIGSFVPAQSARIGVVDRIFTRVGASDRLARGLSTFMVEMIETANILRNATPRSLVLLDEIGRGTSTVDGLSLAWAITETLHDDARRAAKTLFATHYHELTGLVEGLEHAGNFQVSVREDGKTLLFLHQIIPGACDSSYGIHVAEMAGLPAEVVRRARRILLRLEKHQIDPSDRTQTEHLLQKPQTDLFAPPNEDCELVLNELRQVKPEEMTPLQALSFLTGIKEHYKL
ncbi:MAG TPA: DNA mismatch repair protein MutS [Fibrobacteraceae bacterium]|nr:DNA mismatch repair protein MutS [Fibrobacteraceae bacterium]